MAGSVPHCAESGSRLSL